jgi:hypothetical protein
LGYNKPINSKQEQNMSKQDILDTLAFALFIGGICAAAVIFG